MEFAKEVLNDLALIISQPLRDVLPVYLLVLEVRHMIVKMHHKSVKATTSLYLKSAFQELMGAYISLKYRLMSNLNKPISSRKVFCIPYHMDFHSLPK